MRAECVDLVENRSSRRRMIVSLLPATLSHPRQPQPSQKIDPLGIYRMWSLSAREGSRGLLEMKY